MSRLAVLLFASLALAMPPSLLAAPAKPVTVKGKPEEVYAQTKVWTIHLLVSDKAYKTMQPSRGGFPGLGQPAPKKDDKNTERQPRGGFGFDFEWVKASVEIDGTLFDEIGLRFKGSGTYATSGQTIKKPFKIDLDRHIKGQAFKGVRKLTLNNHAMDPTAMRESLAYPVYRAAGVPASRTAYAEVYLTVEGKYKKEFLGLYSLVEPIDKAFLEENFGSSKGLLIKPERIGPLEYLGENWKAYEEKYRPKNEASKKEQQRLIEFVRLVHKGSDDSFGKEIGTYLDVDKFLRFLAATVLVTNLDSFLGVNHNWMAYLDPKTKKFVLMPWDLDLSFGAFFPMGSVQDLQNLSIRQPHPGNNRLIARLLDDPKVYDVYKKHLADLLDKGFTADAIKKDLAAIDKAISPILAREKKSASARKEGAGMGGMFGNVPPADSFVVKRIESVKAQLDGKSKGTPPRSMGMGGGGGPQNPAAPIARQVLQGSDSDKDGKVTKKEALIAAEAFLEACGAKKDGEVDQAALTKALEKLIPQPKGGGGFGGFRQPPQAPLIARRVIEKAGKNGKLSLSSLTSVIEKRFVSADKSGDGKLDAGEIGDVLREVMPIPAFGGPGGFNPGMALARPALEAADKDIDGEVTRDEVTTAAKALFEMCEADKKGEVDQSALTKALDKLLPKQQAFGGFTPPSQAPAIARKVVERAGKLGKVTKAGLVAEAERLFISVDRDRSGRLDELEIAEAMRELTPMIGFGPGGINAAVAIVRPALEAADKDIDGKLTSAEMEAGLKAFVKACEPDKDGQVSQSALTKTLEKLLPRPEGLGGFMFPQMPALAKSLVEKVGKDGKVSEKALLAEAKKRFATADKNEDGKLDEAGLAEALRDLVPAPQFGGPGGGFGKQ